MQTIPTHNVLVIAYYFPPMGLSGVQRTLKFVKYLPQFGWQPTVLTVTPTGYFAQDYTLLEEIHPYHIEIERVGSLDPNRLFRRKGVVKMPSERWRKLLTFFSDLFFIPDNKIGWKKKAGQAGEKLFEKKQFDVIFATAPPFTDFLIGMELSKAFKKPLVVDYRDPWHEYPYKYYPTPWHRWRNYHLEKQVLHGASRIITTNRRVKELILLRYKFLRYDDITIIHQGYDPEDFELDGSVSLQKSEKMRITHAGVFYGDRTPKYFLQALRQLFSNYPKLKGKIEAYFVGNFHDEHQKIIRSLGLESDVVTTGYLDHSRCIQHLLASDVLWLIVNNDKQSPGKLYEYLGARKPILACVPNGFVRQALSEVGSCILVDPYDVDGIARGILQFYEQFEKKQLPRLKEHVVTKYDRVTLTEELSKIFGFLVE
ncbi:MAG: glycosyltransferase [Ignavibacteriae bacterium]|nr:glycosyltransferase [Ignavibacteriota bacterium]